MRITAKPGNSAMSASLLFLICAAQNIISAAPITPEFNVTGNYEIGYVVQNGYYTFQLDITSMDLSTGLFNATADSGLTVSGGIVQGADISFNTSNGGCCDSFGDPLSVTIAFQGLIAPDGSFSGGVTAEINYSPWYGQWDSVSGNATEIVPEPGTAMLFVIGIFGAAGFRAFRPRRTKKTGSE